MEKKAEEKKVPAVVRVLGLQDLVLTIASFNNLEEIARLTTIQTSTRAILESPAADVFYKRAFAAALPITKAQRIANFRLRWGKQARFHDAVDGRRRALCCICDIPGHLIHQDDQNLYVCFYPEPHPFLCPFDELDAFNPDPSRRRAIQLYQRTQKKV
jgi:hypothetical protein